MPIKIEVREERWCCAEKDLLPVKDKTTLDGNPPSGRFGGAVVWVFCKHCGRHHRADTFMDAAGSQDWHYEPQPYPWEKA